MRKLYTGEETIIRRGFLALAAVALIGAGCTTPPTEAQTAQLVAAGQTLAVVASNNSTTVATLVSEGSLFCEKATLTAPLIIALANIYNVPVSVTGMTDDSVKTACALVGGIPVSPPADPAKAVVVPVDVAMVPKV